MVHHDERERARSIDTDERHTQQRALREVEWPLVQIAGQGGEASLDVVRGCRSQIVALNRRPARRPHHLHGFAVHEGERRPQRLVPLEHEIERVREVGRPDRSTEVDLEGHVIDRLAADELFEEPEALLRE